MTLLGPSPEEILDNALAALATGGECRALFDQLAVPVYTTDRDGAVTYWNRACVDFAGRQPELGEDRWCVTWKVFTTTGEPLPHDEYPMAQAIREQRVIRGDIAIAERPDGTRLAFKPYPTPLFDSAGELTGAINLLVDVTEEQGEVLADQAGRCRRLADAMFNRETSLVLSTMADQFDRTAADLRADNDR